MYHEQFCRKPIKVNTISECKDEILAWLEETVNFSSEKCYFSVESLANRFNTDVSIVIGAIHEVSKIRTDLKFSRMTEFGVFYYIDKRFIIC